MKLCADCGTAPAATRGRPSGDGLRRCSECAKDRKQAQDRTREEASRDHINAQRRLRYARTAITQSCADCNADLPSVNGRPSADGHRRCRPCARLRRDRRAYRRGLWREFLAAYGGPRCVGWSQGPCPEQVTDPLALTVGHLHNDGAAHRRRIANGAGRARGRNVTRDLKARGWPQDEGIAVQCANCQLRDMRLMRDPQRLLRDAA